jgi:hypothetical protein
MRAVLLFAALVLLCCAAKASSGKSVGEYYRHSHWIDQETHSIRVDAFSDRIVISERGKRLLIVRGRWEGRAFLRASAPHNRLGYFGVAHEGLNATFFGDARLEKFSFKRIRPDPI